MSSVNLPQPTEQRTHRAADNSRQGAYWSEWRRNNGVFYTPELMSQEMARLLAPKPPALILDPACGKGHLLTAVVGIVGTKGMTFLGIDKDPKALDECRVELTKRNARFRLQQADFFEADLQDFRSRRKNLYVIMNPPFIGYGHMSKSMRKQIRRKVPSLRGRFNSAHAFLKHVLGVLEPEATVSLLPGNWPVANYNDLHGLVQGGGNSWHSLPESKFDNVTTTTGILVVHNISPTPERSRSLSAEQTRTRLIRQGVATGADQVFLKAADLDLRFGKIVPALRGRDVSANLAASEPPNMWVPPQIQNTTEFRDFILKLTEEERVKLANRFCVRDKRQPLWRFHETIPVWFFGTPKLVVPEICTAMSVVIDMEGRFLPLHSTIAIQALGESDARMLSTTLLSKKAWNWLKVNCVSMANGAVRITTPVLRRLLTEVSSDPQPARLQQIAN